MEDKKIGIFIKVAKYCSRIARGEEAIKKKILACGGTSEMHVEFMALERLEGLWLYKRGKREDFKSFLFRGSFKSFNDFLARRSPTLGTVCPVIHRRHGRSIVFDTGN